MNQHRAFIVGNSLYSESITEILINSETVEVIGTAPTLVTALTLLKVLEPDVVVVAGTFEEETLATVGAFIGRCAHLPILRTDLSTRRVQLITSQCFHARSFDLLAAIAGLPRNNTHATAATSVELAEWATDHGRG